MHASLSSSLVDGYSVHTCDVNRFRSKELLLMSGITSRKQGADNPLRLFKRPSLRNSPVAIRKVKQTTAFIAHV